jgi:hypothetical protein
MRLVSLCVCLLTLSTTCAAGAAPIAGDWAYTSTKLDALSGEPEQLFMSIQMIGNKVCGRFMSAYRGGMRIAEGEFHGTVGANQVTVTYEAGWAGVTGTGIGRLRMRGQQLEWRVTRPGPEPDYMVRTAILRPSGAKLEKPAKCE